MTKYAYIRVSTKEQNEDRQLLAMEKVKIKKRNLFIDKQSGQDFNRPSYQRLLQKLEPGDIIYVKSIDRLGRNYEEILEQWRIITKEIKADIIVLDMPLLDTTRGRDLLGTFISDLVLQLLSFVAETERTNIKQRQAEGIEAAKQRGVQFGRPPLPLPENSNIVLEAWRSGAIGMKETTERLGLSRATLYRRLKSIQKGNL